MAAPFGAGSAGWPTLAKVIELFTAMGCELRVLPGTVLNPDGGSELVRYFYNPDNQTLVAITGFDDDNELVSPSEVENFERRLDRVIPKNW